MKARYLDEQHPGHGVTFATGTPISNTMMEMYTLQRFLDPEGLRQRGIEHFDGWAATFGDIVETKAALSITPPDPAAPPLPPAHDLAERIKALKAAHTIEAAPPRLTARSAATAEEPVTARLRHRVQERPTLEPEAEPIIPASPPHPSPPAAAAYRPAQPALFQVPPPHAGATRRFSPKPNTSHQEDVSADDWRSKRQLSLF
jgi:hypothetical protein